MLMHNAPDTITFGQNLGGKHDFPFLGFRILPDFFISDKGIDTTEEDTFIFHSDIHTILVFVGSPG